MAGSKKKTAAPPPDLGDLGLADTSFADATTDIPPRIVLSLEGDWSTGKSSFALSAPGPIAVINIDNNLEGVKERFIVAGKRVLVANYRLDVKIEKGKATMAGSEAEELWECLVRDYKAALKSKIRTLVIDNATEFWEMARLARLGRLAQVMPMQYGPVNAEFRELMRKASDADVNLILVHKTKAEYVNDKASGKRVRAGFTDMEFVTQVVGRTGRVTEGEGDQEHKEFRVAISKCTPNNSVTETDLGHGPGVLQGDSCNFATLAGLIFPDTPSEWWGE